jgi:hypothetical protein
MDFVSNRNDVVWSLLGVHRKQFDRNKTLSTSDKLDQNTLAHDASDLAPILIANGNFVGQSLDHHESFLNDSTVRGAYENAAILLNIDRSTSGVRDLLDVCAARADQGADLLRVDLDRCDLRSTCRIGFAWLVNFGIHDIQDLESGDLCLVKGACKHIVGNAIELGIKL